MCSRPACRGAERVGKLKIKFTYAGLAMLVVAGLSLSTPTLADSISLQCQLTMKVQENGKADPALTFQHIYLLTINEQRAVILVDQQNHSVLNGSVTTTPKNYLINFNRPTDLVTLDDATLDRETGAYVGQFQSLVADTVVTSQNVGECHPVTFHPKF